MVFPFTQIEKSQNHPLKKSLINGHVSIRPSMYVTSRTLLSAQMGKSTKRLVLLTQIWEWWYEIKWHFFLPWYRQLATQLLLSSAFFSWQDANGPTSWHFSGWEVPFHAEKRTEISHSFEQNLFLSLTELNIRNSYLCFCQILKKRKIQNSINFRFNQMYGDWEKKKVSWQSLSHQGLVPHYTGSST